MDDNREREVPQGMNPGGLLGRGMSWFRNYWYYYKLPILIGLFFVLILASILISVFTKEKTDFTVAFVSQVGMTEEERTAMRQNFAEYLPDIDGNGKNTVGVTPIQIGVALSDEFSVAAYDSLTSMLLFDEVVFLVVDDYSARYLQDIQALEPLANLGITGGENEYRVKITGTPLLKDTTLGEYIDFYVVVKRFSESEQDNARYLARRDAIRPMLEEVLG